MKVSKEIERKLHRVYKLAREMQDLEIEISRYFDKKGIDQDVLSDGSGMGLDSVEYGECTVEDFLKHIEQLVK